VIAGNKIIKLDQENIDQEDTAVIDQKKDPHQEKSKYNNNNLRKRRYSRDR
jgi:hypothetical protein